jgi:hypothetical protein
MQIATRIAMIVSLTAASAHAQVSLSGRVVDEDGAPLARARVSVHRAAEAPQTAETGPTGSFAFQLPDAGAYLVSVQRVGYFQLSDRPVDVNQAGHPVTLILNPNREIFQTVTVGESSSPVDPAETGREQRLSGTEVNDIPYPATQSFKNSLKLIPGVIEDPAAGIHVHGAAEYQTQYTLDGFDITDPITGRFNTTLAVEGIRSVDVLAARESAQYGRGSAGTMAVRVDNGTDLYHFTATNFIPGLDTRNGLSLGAWSPRAGFSGPLKKGRAWFSDSITGGYSNGFVSGLPRGQNTNSGWSAGNLFHSQVNLTQSNILFGDFLSNFNSQAHSGLGVLDPIATTSSRHSDEWLIAGKDSQAWRSGAYLEFGLAIHRVFHQSTPQGPALYIISPEGRSGNYFVNSREHGGRKQVFVNFFPPMIHGAGRHQLQTGVDFQRLDYTAGFHRTGFEILGLDGLPEFETNFIGSGNFHLPNSAEATYITDHWTIFKPLAADIGVRQDWDRLTGRSVIAPRLAMAWSPFEQAHTKLVGGYSIIYDAANLSTFAHPLDQQAVTIPFTNGVPGMPFSTTFLPGHDLRLPRYSQFSAGVEHDFGHGLYATADWLRKRGTDGFVYAAQSGEPIAAQQYFPGSESGGTYVLTNQRRDRYDEYAITVRQSLPNQYEWLASYVRSHAISNAVLDISVDQTLQVTNNFGPVPWDAPNRFLSEGYLPVHFKDWAVAYLADWRTGFPYSIVTPANQIIGNVNSQRFGSNFDLNLHVEKRLVLFRYRIALRVGANNLTDHRNATAVNNVLGAPSYLQYFGSEGRHFVVRLRVFGRVK